jgi:hypothetical protein
VQHAILTGLVFGFMIGAVVLVAKLGGHLTLWTPWIAAVSVCVFTTIFYFSMTTSEFHVAALLGALAGFGGHLVWGALDIIVEGKSDSIGESLLAFFPRTLVGICYGLASGVIIFAFRRLAREWMPHWTLRVLTVAAMGGLAFFLISLIVPHMIGAAPGAPPSRPLMLGLIGALLNVGLAYSCRLLRESRGASEVPG